MAAQLGLLSVEHVIRLRTVKEAVKQPWRGRYAAVTRPGDSLLLSLGPSCLWAVSQLSKRSILARSLVD